MSKSETAEQESDDEWPAEYHQRIAKCSDPEQPYHDKEVMEFLYLEEEMAQTAMSNLFGCSQSSIGTWLEKHKIPKRSFSEALRVNRRDHVPVQTTSHGYVAWWEKSHTVYVHRLLAVAEHGFDAVTSDHDIHHKNGIKWDNRPDNIEVRTHADHSTEPWKLTGLDRLRAAELYENGDVGSYIVARQFDTNVSNFTVLRAHREFYGNE